MTVRALATIVMQAAEPGPFFTADAEGLMKLLLFAGAIVGGLYALWYKAHIVPVRHEIRDLAGRLAGWTDPNSPDRLARHSDVNGLGERVDRVEGSDAKHSARLDIVEGTVRDHSRDMAHVAEQLGRTLTWVEQCGRDTQTMKEEIIGFASERFDKLTGQIGALTVQVAVVTEQVRQLQDEQRGERRGQP